MNRFDLTPLYSNSVGFDRLASLLDGTFRNEQSSVGYPPYDIESIGEDRYAISLAVAGFVQDELDIQVERDILTVTGRKAEDKTKRNYLHQGIAARSFERKFNLADHVVVTGANFNSGLLTIDLTLEIPEEMKPKRIDINSDSNVIEHLSDKGRAA